MCSSDLRIDGMPLLLALIGGGLCATVFGVLFGIPSLRIRGLYLAVATLAAQFFTDWFTNRVPWVTNNSSSGSVSVRELSLFGMAVETPAQKYLLCLGIVSLHFTGMSAITIVPDMAVSVPEQLLSGGILTLAVGSITSMIILGGLGAVAIESQTSRSALERIRRLATRIVGASGLFSRMVARICARGLRRYLGC